VIDKASIHTPTGHKRTRAGACGPRPVHCTHAQPKKGLLNHILIGTPASPPRLSPPSLSRRGQLLSELLAHAAEQNRRLRRELPANDAVRVVFDILLRMRERPSSAAPAVMLVLWGVRNPPRHIFLAEGGVRAMERACWSACWGARGRAAIHKIPKMRRVSRETFGAREAATRGERRGKGSRHERERESVLKALRPELKRELDAGHFDPRP
jgi:hypothetical protein